MQQQSNNSQSSNCNTHGTFSGYTLVIFQILYLCKSKYLIIYQTNLSGNRFIKLLKKHYKKCLRPALNNITVQHNIINIIR